MTGSSSEPKQLEAWPTLRGGATAEGKKELIAIADGYRESEQSWKSLLLDVKQRGLRGLRVGLIDQYDFASGASSKSSRLLHGGLLYFVLQTATAALPIGDLAPGRYRVVASMFDSKGDPLTSVPGEVCEAETYLIVAPRAPDEVVFDRNGICRVNGEPFFPIGMYWGSSVIHRMADNWRQETGQGPLSLEQWYRELRAMGINLIQDALEWNVDAEDFTGVKERADLMHRVGLRTFNSIHVDHEDRIPTLAESPGLFGWYIFDEPTQFREVYIEQTFAPRHRRIGKLDLYHPRMLYDNTVWAMRLESPYTDVLMPDLYPQRDGDMRIVGRAVAELKALKDGNAAVLPVIQAFQISRYSPRPDGSMYSFGRLAYEEMRVIVFDAIACGATGIAYYTSEGPQDLPNGEVRSHYLLDDFPDQREAMTKINGQLEQLVPAILTAQQRPTTISSEDSDANARAFVHEDRCYVLVTNPDREVVDVRVGVLGVPGQQGRDMYSNTTAAIEIGYFNLTLRPLDVFVFAFNL